MRRFLDASVLVEAGLGAFAGGLGDGEIRTSNSEVLQGMYRLAFFNCLPKGMGRARFEGV